MWLRGGGEMKASYKTPEPLLLQWFLKAKQQKHQKDRQKGNDCKIYCVWLCIIFFSYCVPVHQFTFRSEEQGKMSYCSKIIVFRTLKEVLYYCLTHETMFNQENCEKLWKCRFQFMIPSWLYFSSVVVFSFLRDIQCLKRAIRGGNKRRLL